MKSGKTTKTKIPKRSSPKMKNPVAFWKELSPEAKRAVKFVTGLAMVFLAMLFLMAVTSYIFTWREDQSLVQALRNGVRDMDAANIAGSLGARIAYVLVTRWFGLGAYAVVAFLVLAAGKMLAVKKSGSYLRLFVLCLTGALLSSYMLTVLSSVFGMGDVFRSGLGGDSGASAVQWFQSLIGGPLTFLFLLILCIVWLFFASSSFARMIFRKKDEIFNRGDEEDDESVKKEEMPADETVEESVAETPKKKFKWWPSKKKEDEPVVEPSPVVEESGREVEVESVIDAPKNPIIEKEVSFETNPEPEVKDPEVPEKEETKLSDMPEIIEGQELTTEVEEELPNIDVKDELRDYQMPSLNLLDDYSDKRYEVPDDELKRNNIKICHALNTYGIQVSDVKAAVGPTVTLYKVYPAPGVRVSQIKNLSDDIALALQVKGVRIITLPDAVGIEVPNDRRSVVPLKAMLNDESFRNSDCALPIAIGYTITQQVKVFDLADAPHLLVAGATKQGKSVGLNVIISSLLYSKHPSQLKLVFIDPKMVEFSAYARLLKHYLAVLPTAAGEDDEKANAIVKKPKQAADILKSLCIEMDERYELLSKAMVNDVRPYNKKYESRRLLPTEGHKYLPYLVVVIDEYADLTMSAGGSGEAKTMAREISTSIIRLAQKGRAAGIHMVIATQRPSVDVITGTIKTNFPMRIAFRTVSAVDSKTILDMPGAEKLIGKGDMLFYAGVDVERVQCAFISNDEIMKVTSFVEDQNGYRKSYNTPYYLPAPAPDQSEEGGSLIDMKDLDARFMEAAKLVVSSQRGSTSDLQRRLGMGYAKAGRVMDQLEAAGIVGPQEGSKPRQVLVSTSDELDEILKAYMN